MPCVMAVQAGSQPRLLAAQRPQPRRVCDGSPRVRSSRLRNRPHVVASALEVNLPHADDGGAEEERPYEGSTGRYAPEYIAEFDFNSFEAYRAVDDDYSDQPRRGNTYHSMLLPGEVSLISYVGTDKLPDGYKFAPFVGNDKKEIVMLQGFDWDSWTRGEGWYNYLTSLVDDIKACSFTHLWLPPPSQSVSAEGYLPSVLYNLDSKYGTYSELKMLVQMLNSAGVVPMADIVINHRCAQKQDENGVWNVFDNEYQKKFGLGGYGADHMRGINWDQWAIVSDDTEFGGSGNPDTGMGFDGAPDLDHSNPELREALKDWMVWLHEDVGFAGWRMDFVKGYGAEYVKEYIEGTIGADAFHVSEMWADMYWEGDYLCDNQDGARQALCDWCDASGAVSPVFDFPTKANLQYAVAHCEYWRLARDGKPSGLLGWWPDMAVTFVDNHDTGGVQSHWPFPKYHVPLGYAYILTHPGTPCVFWPHLYGKDEELSETIRSLMQLRRAAGIRSDSPIEITCADHDMYVAVINGNVIVKMGPRKDMGFFLPAEHDGWSLAVSGKDYAVWTRV